MSDTSTPTGNYNLANFKKVRIVDLYDDEDINDYNIEELKKEYDCDIIGFNLTIRRIENRFEILDL